jgi:flagella basal body P-ring formation protein FlgA
MEKVHNSSSRALQRTTGFILPFIACIFFLRAAPVAPAQSFNLQTNVLVDGEGIFLAQLLMPDPAHPVPQVEIAEAPRFGQATMLTRSQILDVLQKSAPGLSTNQWLGAEKIRITRRARAFSESEIKEQLTALLQREHVKDKGELELRFMRPWLPILLPDEALTFKILDLPSGGISSSCIVRFELSTRRETLGSWQAPVSARVWREIWVARSQLRKDQLLSEADVVRERRDVLNLRDPLIPAQSEGVLEIAENVPAGAPLYARSVRSRPVVRRGQVVEAQVLAGAMTISLKVEVMENGAPGQTVRVRNLQSRREFRGKVQNEQTVLVVL